MKFVLQIIRHVVWTCIKRVGRKFSTAFDTRRSITTETDFSFYKEITFSYLALQVCCYCRFTGVGFKTKIWLLLCHNICSTHRIILFFCASTWDGTDPRFVPKIKTEFSVAFQQKKKLDVYQVLFAQCTLKPRLSNNSYVWIRVKICLLNFLFGDKEHVGLQQVSQCWDLGVLLMSTEDGTMPPGVWNAGQHVCSKINVMYNIFIRCAEFTGIVRVLFLGDVKTFGTLKRRNSVWKSSGSIMFALW